MPRAPSTAAFIDAGVRSPPLRSHKSGSGVRRAGIRWRVRNSYVITNTYDMRLTIFEPFPRLPRHMLVGPRWPLGGGDHGKTPNRHRSRSGAVRVRSSVRAGA